MTWNLTSSLRVNGTLVADEFIDRFMASASGEYVKVYLYLLRHQGEDITVGQIAEALNHTESDVKRAAAYWKKCGLIRDLAEQEEAAAAERPEQRKVPAADVSVYSRERVERMARDEDFSQLIYVAQKYMNKIFTQKDCQIFAYLYDELKMSCELLEYLVEYCVQNGHTSIRYIETVARNWHEKGFVTVEQAKSYAAGFTRECFSVMKAFGLTDRKPAEMERQMIEKWFRSMGFSAEIVLEACNRTVEKTHGPNFSYADKILTEWKKAGVHTLADVRMLDEAYQNRNRTGAGKGEKRSAKSPNQFHNFEQRNTDYDAMMAAELKEKLKKGLM